MAKATKHRDVEFHVELGPPRRGRLKTKVFQEYRDAAAYAIELALRHSGDVLLDVVIWSSAGARWFGGDDGVERYKRDPDASVFERLLVNADSAGMVP